MDMIYWDHYYNAVLLVNLLIIIALFACLRWFSGLIAHIDASDELLRKDNPAFGISLMGAILGVTIVLTGTIYGAPDSDLLNAAVTVGVFGILGIVFMALTRVIFGKITLPSISLRDEIVGGNMAVAIADAGNVLAAAIIIRAVMIWVPEASSEGLLIVLGGYVISQIILTLTTLLKIRGFGTFHKGYDFQQELKNGNIAVALRFSGKKIGTAFAIATAAQIVVYEESNAAAILMAWFLASIAVIVIWEILCIAAERFILFRVNLDQEILEQKNTALGLLQGIIFISLGLLIWSL